ncbi:flavin reductase family protein [Methanofollis formosanus]|uniref:Flavin reductase family protein n=1 Tax=Methanofollis formosanus TaxID=299308 RepID=A0A8G1EFX2_9EURY|nr:flavin reductase family protein [Methanofollis formosanus]QYZ78556.1 flavin reductase family protein [Methanofollis formosanus]
MELPPHRRENVLPLPVVLISTVSPDGMLNAAPWGNITPILRPLDEIVLASWLKRDTLENIRATGEFVVNIPTAGMSREVMVCARHYPPEVDEFAEAGLTPHPSKTVRPPGIEGCIAWMECTLVEEICRDKYVLVIGKVERLEVDDRFFTVDGEMDPSIAKPLCMLCGKSGMRFTCPGGDGEYRSYAEMFSWEGSA